MNQHFSYCILLLTTLTTESGHGFLTMHIDCLLLSPMKPSRHADANEIVSWILRWSWKVLFACVSKRAGCWITNNAKVARVAELHTSQCAIQITVYVNSGLFQNSCNHNPCNFSVWQSTLTSWDYLFHEFVFFLELSALNFWSWYESSCNLHDGCRLLLHPRYRLKLDRYPFVCQLSIAPWYTCYCTRRIKFTHTHIYSLE